MDRVELRAACLAAAAVFEADGDRWGQGAYTGLGCRCLVGEVRWQLGNRLTADQVGAALERLRVWSGWKHGGPELWNDERGRTVEEVIAKLREAAEVLRPAS